ncbi:MAG TPA: LptF/LptG family permease [Flavobacterium sp.]|nr:LptF/LptG family permease [Flavobacterium sp.]HLP64676.1 LptF/LptG family permease [Flavobacterium sp.]
MKILDKYLLKSFLITFTTVFVILFFIFILQTVWLFISELAGKDLDFFMVVKFLVFSMPRIVPLVLPLSVLLASIMTFGSLSENYEFAAMKSSGISLQRAMRSLTFFILFLSIVAFVFANNVIPYAEYKFINFRRNIAQVKPAMAIAEGQFSEIGNYTIKVQKKSGENGNLLSDVIIHIKSSTGEGNKTVIRANRGELVSSENSNTLKLLLFDGYYYEDIFPKKYEERKRLPFAKATFKRDVINIDLSKLNSQDDTGEITNTNTMLNISELNYTLDSLNTNYKRDITSYAENIYQRVNTTMIVPKSATPLSKISDFQSHFSTLDKDRKLQVYNVAKSNVEGTVFSIDSSKFEMEEKQKNINSHWIALYDKFVIAFACILMFFIGAPLGAIIRKGGLGLPIVFAVGIFIIFHFINTFGKKVAQENGITPFLGTWMSSMVLSPLAIILTYRATNDIGGMFNFDAVTVPIQKFFGSLFSKKETVKAIELPNEVNEMLPSEPVSSSNFTSELAEYRKFSNISLILNLIATVAFFIVKNNTSIVLLIIGFVLLLIGFLYCIYRSQKKLDEIGILTNTNVEPGIAVSMVTGFPFYFIIYLYNNTLLKGLLSEKK